MAQPASPLFSLFADLLAYPGPALLERATEGVAALAATEPRAADELERFRTFLGAVESAWLEEHYTSLFDLPASCPPYVGYQLLGEDWRRSQLLARLNRRYRERGFSAGRELPDHLAVMLRYLAWGGGGPEEAQLLDECLLPCLERMSARLGAADRGYGALFRAMRLGLQAVLDGGELAASAG